MYVLDENAIIDIAKKWKVFFINTIGCVLLNDNDKWSKILQESSIETVISIGLEAVGNVGTIDDYFAALEQKANLKYLDRLHNNLSTNPTLAKPYFENKGFIVNLIKDGYDAGKFGILGNKNSKIPTYVVKLDVSIEDILIFDELRKTAYVVQFVKDFSYIPELAVVNYEIYVGI